MSCSSRGAAGASAAGDTLVARAELGGALHHGEQLLVVLLKTPPGSDPPEKPVSFQQLTNNLKARTTGLFGCWVSVDSNPSLSASFFPSLRLAGHGHCNEKLSFASLGLFPHGQDFPEATKQRRSIVRTSGVRLSQRPSPGEWYGNQNFRGEFAPKLTSRKNAGRVEACHHRFIPKRGWRFSCLRIVTLTTSSFSR